MRRAFPPVLLALAAALAVAAPAGAALFPAASSAPTGRALVLLRAPHGLRAQAAAAQAFAARTGGRLRGPAVPQIGMVTVAIPAGTSPSAFVAALRRDPAVRDAHVEGRMSLRVVPNDPALTTAETASGTPPGTPVQWTVGKEDLPAAWDITRGDGATVAIIDTGADASHPELNGKIDQAVDHDSDPLAGPATTDENGHGTHVSSLACAASGNGVGIAGAGFDCRLIIEKSDLTDGSIVQSIVDATDRRADAINMSFGDDGSRGILPEMATAIDYAYARGVLLVAAAADDALQEQGQPADILQPTGSGPNIDQGKGLSVTSADFFDAPSGAGVGTQISLAAYGSFARFDTAGGPPGLLAAFPGNTTELETGSPGPPPVLPCGCRASFGGDSRYAYLQGTSMSAPQVTAIGALMRHFNPDIHISELIRILKASARRPAGGGWSSDLGWGILDGGAALAATRRVDHRPPTSRLLGPRTVRGRSVRLRWSGSDPALPGLIPSGIARFELYRSVNGGPFRRIARTSRRSLRLRGRRGARYAFFTIAVDRAGNREARPARADLVTRFLRR